MFVVIVAIIAALFGSTVGVAETGVFHGLLLVYGTGHVLVLLTDTAHVTEAGLEVSPLLTALTENVCEPFARFEYDAGEVHAE